MVKTTASATTIHQSDICIEQQATVPKRVFYSSMSPGCSQGHPLAHCHFIHIYCHIQTSLIEHYSSLNTECLLMSCTLDISLSCLVCSGLVEKEGISLVLK